MNKFVGLCLVMVMALTSTMWAGQITPYLADRLQDLSAEGEIEVLVMFANQADVPALNRQLKLERATLAERNRRVIDALQETASETHPIMTVYFDGLQSRNLISNYKLLWVANMCIVKSSPTAIYDMATRSDIANIYYNYNIESNRPVDSDYEPPLTTSHEVGLDRINAPAAWAAGFTGAGRVVANMDTGVSGVHPALAARFRGDVDDDGDVDESWYDPYAGWTFPQDSGQHGTHTMGTICGRTESGSDTIGVAIDAQWIAAAPIDRGGGISGTIADALLSFQWFMDPDDNPNTQDNPDVIGNSWGIPDGAGYPDCDQTFWVVIDNCEAAGTMVVFSAGNEGSSGLRSPADRATTYYNCFAVGAVDGSNPSLPAAYFSARGPSECAAGDLAIKPEVTAPGVNIRSSIPGGGYTTMSGTSMSSPHVSGAVALIRQANPNIDVETIKDILMSTAVDLPASNPNGEDNTFGHGIIDIYQACVIAQSGFGNIDGYVNNENNSPVDGAKVTVNGSLLFSYADNAGYYFLAMPADTTYSLTASYFGLIPQTVDVAVIPNDTVSQDFTLDFAETGILSGHVTDLDMNPIEGAVLDVVGTPLDPENTDGQGQYIFDNIPAGPEYLIRATASGFGTATATVIINEETPTVLDFTLQTLESFEVNNGYWTGEGVWEWGFSSMIPEGAYDGNNVWGTVLNSNYPPNADDNLLTCNYSITDSGASFTFYHWYDTDNGWDGVNVHISTNSGVTWEIITPEGGYPDLDVNGLDYEPGFTGESNGWEQEVFDLSSYQGQIVKFKFRFGSDGVNNHNGWYVDGVVLNGGISWGGLYPDIAIGQTYINAVVDSSETETHNLIITNNGEGILEYSAEAITDEMLAAIIPGNGTTSPVDDNFIEREAINDIVSYNYVGPKSESNDIGGDIITDFGGPDGFGYTWKDSNEPDGPTYNWIDIAAIGEQITGMGDDTNLGPYDIGFEFPFYGNIFTTFRICSNGWFSFTATNTSYGNVTIPSGANPFNLIAPLWDDLNFRYGGDLYYYSSGDSLIISYIDVAHHTTGGPGPYTFQAILLADGEIIFQYADINDPIDSHTIGIQNEDGTIGLQVAYNQIYTEPNLAVKIKYPVFWLTVSPIAGAVFPEESATVGVTFDASEAGPGTYTGQIRITSNDEDSPTIAVACTMRVIETGVEDNADILPAVFTLNQNYPNPFNPKTEILFGLPNNGYVTLEIYDVMGRRVNALVDGNLQAGSHKIIWDGTNDRNESVSSGMYFYKLSQSEKVITKKMMLLK